ncbi:MAG: type II toxin-antitoxin system Phd/YefM family antitoxin [Mycobacteriales bacterium]
MAEVSIRELRNHGGDVIERVAKGETAIVTRGGVPVAEIRPLERRSLSAEEIVARWRGVPTVDLQSLRNDLDALIDSSL